jgi:glyceraldehyde-3-phosphate dehydrogenase/erythrose-4-phosphate dehydrogenase
MKDRIIYIRGVGVIGWPLAGLFLSLKNLLPEIKIVVEPYKVNAENIHHLEHLCKLGAMIVNSDLNFVNEASKWFALRNVCEALEVRESCEIVLDCSPSGVAEKRMSEYAGINYPNSKAFIAQGSEHKFGKQLLFPDNTEILENTKDSFFHISTCNTHSLSAILRVFNSIPVKLKTTDFVILRRDADMAKNDPHVTGPLFQFPEGEHGTHHARLLNELYRTVNQTYNVTSSAMTVNSPYMHITRFRMELEEKVSREEILECINNDPLLSLTSQVSSNMIFSSGRERGEFGRIFSHAVFVEPSLEVNGNIVRGIATTPGDSNVLISTIYATLKILGHERINEVMQELYGKVLKWV